VSFVKDPVYIQMRKCIIITAYRQSIPYCEAFPLNKVEFDKIFEVSAKVCWNRVLENGRVNGEEIDLLLDPDIWEQVCKIQGKTTPSGCIHQDKTEVPY
jgi:hypothetical protein